MKEYPILFSTPMVQAILAGRKTQTRRIVKKQPVYDQDSGYKYWDNLMFDIHDDVLETMYMPDHCPYGEVGSTLWVRETFIPPMKYGTINRYIYKAEEDLDCFKGHWKPSIFMPKETCRIKLEITNIRVERIRDISEGDAIAEGIVQLNQSLSQLLLDGIQYLDYSKRPELFNDGLAAKESYKSLWEKINGKDSWSINSWVWVIEFKKL